MTRATLLHVLERPTALGPAEVRELEQLAQAFPYCQTAHLLLAKAAHDQGTMLAGQRLRRAATYAADRTLLRRLIEQEEVVEQEAVEATPQPVVLPAAPHPLDLVDWPDEYVPPTAASAVAPPLPAAVAAPAPAEELPPVAPPSTPGPAPTAPPVAEVPIVEAPVAAAVIAAPTVTPPVLPELVAPAEPEATSLADLPLALPASPALAVPVELPADAVAAVGKLTEVLTAATAPAEMAAAEASEAVTPSAPATPETAITAPAAAETGTALAEPALADIAENPAPVAVLPTAPVEPALPPGECEPLPAPPIVLEAAAINPVSEAAAATVIEEPEAELPPQAPAIRPPVEVGEARFEFGLADPAPVAAVATYELPGLVDEWAASAVTRSMGTAEALAPAALAPVGPVFTPAAFTGDAVVGYAFGESSRLGLSMQLLDLLAARAEAAESATAVVAAAQPPASALPPTGTFFEPDPLLLDHWATHRPAAPELPSTVDLINNFLKRQPRLTRPAMLPPSATHQADLSVRSTRAEPDLVSENLARIFVRQGKTARAIEIYEKLMVKQPEKMAYFALQIQSLQPSA